MTEPRLLIVSNRLPVTVRVEQGEIAVTQSAGGLATGLRGPHERSGGLWIGWPGDTSKLDAPQRARLEKKLADIRAVPLYLDPGEVSRFYEGFSNGVLWPLFHYLLDRIPLWSRDWDAYERANQRFADLVVEHYRPGDVIWVHDYQLMLVPGMLRRRLPSATIGFFLHIPFPASEAFRILPWREEILEGLLGADLIGFHTFSYLAHFSSSLLRILGVEAAVDHVRHGGRRVQLGVFPMGIDAARFASLGGNTSVAEEAEAIRATSPGCKILVGVDRLDYTKGIPRRLLAIERLLQREPGLRGKVKLVQVAVPSRAKVQAYERFRKEVDEMVGRINGAYGSIRSVPIHYLYRSVSESELVALYRAADVMLVTPLRDGLNLVSKEFIASRVDDDGVLLLSEFAGAASELGQALLVNPFDVDRTAAAISRALSLRPEERQTRMRSMRKRVLAYDVHRWVNEFLEALATSSEQSGKAALRTSSTGDIDGLISRLRYAKSRLLLLDYDGTLVPFASSPELAAPDEELLELLRALARQPGMSLHVVSGRARDDLERWFEGEPFGLHAEHGFWSRSGPNGGWKGLVEDASLDWKRRVRPILDLFAGRTPGSLVEEKRVALVWHYRMADPEFGSIQAKELRLHLSNLLSNLPVEVIQGHKVVEVRMHGVNKGAVVGPLLAQGSYDAVLALGDDATDEDMFAALPAEAIAVHVGPGESRAPFRIADPHSTRALLKALL